MLKAMTAVFDQLPALLGVLLGAAGAMASSTLTDRLRWRRDQAARWDQRRVDAYIAFASTMKDAARISHRLTAPYRLQTDFETHRLAATKELDDAAGRSPAWTRWPAASTGGCGDHCDTRSHVVSELVEEVRRMSET